jgi:cobalt/nickel transport system permease protein
MRLDASGDPGKRTGPVHRLDARVKLVFALAFVIAVVATPIGQWRILGILGLLLALLVGVSGADVRALLLRWAGFALVVGFLAVMVAPGLPARARHGLVAVILSIVVKNSLAFLMMLVLATVTSWLDMLQAMRRLRVPRVMVATLQFMERYVHVLRDELARMSQARAARTVRGGSLLSWRLLTGMLGLLLLGSFERAERVHSAMLARGWDGTIRHLN